MTQKTGGDLLDNPDEFPMDDPVGLQTPFDKATDLLSTTEGKTLEIMTRTTQEIAEAAAISYGLSTMFGLSYIKGRMEQIERLAISRGGQGRTDIVDSLKAGSGVSDGFYETQTTNKTYEL